MKVKRHEWATQQPSEDENPITTHGPKVIMAIGFISGLILLFVFAFGPKAQDKANQATPTSQQTKPGYNGHVYEPVLRKYTAQELKEFWDRELNYLVVEQWSKAQLPYPEINQRYLRLFSEITNRTGTNLSIALVRTNHWLGTSVEAAASLDRTNNQHCMDLYIPVMMNTYEKLERSGIPKWHKVFESHIIVALMHELEHTANTNVATAVDIGEESRAWADTCRYTIVPLLDVYNVPLDGSDAKPYLAWKQGGGNTNSVEWKTFMEGRYGDIDGRTK